MSQASTWAAVGAFATVLFAVSLAIGWGLDRIGQRLERGRRRR